MPEILLNRSVQRAFSKAADHYDEHAVLQREVSGRLLERLDYVKLTPQWVLDVGAGTGFAAQGLALRYGRARIAALDISEAMLLRLAQKLNWRSRRRILPLMAMAEALPLADNSVDLIFSSLTLQWCVKLDAVFQEFQRVLKPGGLLMFATLGPDTLYELRQSWAELDGEQHVNQFLDMHNIGDQLLKNRFAGPVMDAERITMTYPNLGRLMKDLKKIGANTVLNSSKPGLLGKDRYRCLQAAYEAYRSDNVLPATYEIVYGHAWKGEEPVAGGAEHPVLWKK